MPLLNSFIAEIWMTYFAKWEGKNSQIEHFRVSCNMWRAKGENPRINDIFISNRCCTIIYVRKEMRPTLRYFKIFESLELNTFIIFSLIFFIYAIIKS